MLPRPRIRAWGFAVGRGGEVSCSGDGDGDAVLGGVGAGVGQL